MSHYDPTYDQGDPYGTPGAFQPPLAPESEPSKSAKGTRRARKPRAEKVVTNRLVSSNQRIALLFGVLAALTVAFFLSSTEPPRTYVARTTQQIQALTEVSESQVEIVQAPKGLVEEGAVSGSTAEEVSGALEQSVFGKQTLTNLASGQQIRSSQFGSSADLERELGADERLVSVRASVAAAAAGTIRPGDRVDVIAATDSGGAGDSIAGVVLNNVEVVSVQLAESDYQALSSRQTSVEGRNDAPSDLLPSDPIPGTYLLRVPSESVPRVVAVDTGARVVLALRAGNAQDSPSEPIDAITAICAGSSDPTCGANAG